MDSYLDGPPIIERAARADPASLRQWRFDKLSMCQGDPHRAAPNENPGPASQQEVIRYLGRLIVDLAVEIELLKQQLRIKT